MTGMAKAADDRFRTALAKALSYVLKAVATAGAVLALTLTGLVPPLKAAIGATWRLAQGGVARLRPRAAAAPDPEPVVISSSRRPDRR
jgi:hypothetical protein